MLHGHVFVMLAVARGRVYITLMMAQFLILAPASVR